MIQLEKISNVVPPFCLADGAPQGSRDNWSYAYVGRHPDHKLVIVLCRD